MTFIKESNSAKLLDAWNAPTGAGEPVGIIATTFTFESIFFEEECLGRFLNIQSDPSTDGPFYIIEMEEKLFGLECAAVLVDQHHCKGNRNLRWDMILGRGKNGGILHSKISVLYWSNLIRIIVASANLTEKGYRENQEIFGIIDFTSENDIGYDLVRSYVNYLKYSVSQTTNNIIRPDIKKFQDLLERVDQIGKIWDNGKPLKRKKSSEMLPLLIRPGGKSVFEQLNEIWKNNAKGVPNQIIITSPFFNPPEDINNLPSKEVWKLLSQRGPIKVTYNVPIENYGLNGDKTILRAPSTLAKNKPSGRLDAKIEFRILNEIVHENTTDFFRSLHLKSIVLQNDEWIVYMVGSSNFTSSGLGFNGTFSYEGNLVYVVSGKNKRELDLVRKSILYGDKIKGEYTFIEDRIINEDESGDEIDPTLPAFFNSLILTRTDICRIQMTFDGTPPPGFTIMDDEGNILLDEQIWTKLKSPLTYNLEWGNKSVPSGLFVKWQDSIGKAFWPLIIENRDVLPPPEELRDLKLEILIQILTSARPFHQVIKSWIRGKDQIPNSYSTGEIIDPHKKVDTSSFILQRTRRISNAFYGIKQRLERPVYTKETLQWRLYGPIGVMALVKAIQKDENSSPEEIAFLLCETALEISRVNYEENSNSLKKDEVNAEFKMIIGKLYTEAKTYQKDLQSDMKKYMRKAFKNCLL